MSEPSSGAAPLEFSPYELYMLGVSVLALGLLAADTLLALQPPIHQVLGWADTGLCGLFFLDFLRSWRRAPDRGRYLVRVGWLDLASSVPTVGVLRLGRVVRIARIIRILRAVRSVRTIGQVVVHHRRQSALLAAGVGSLLLILFASLAVLQFEAGTESTIRTGGDALWWALTTITTVGYGDRYPVTVGGRLVAAGLMAAGVALFGTLSALVAAWLLEGEQGKSEDQVALLTAEVARLREAVEQERTRRSAP